MDALDSCLSPRVRELFTHIHTEPNAEYAKIRTGLLQGSVINFEGICNKLDRTKLDTDADWFHQAALDILPSLQQIHTEWLQSDVQFENCRPYLGTSSLRRYFPSKWERFSKIDRDEWVKFGVSFLCLM